MHDFQNSIIRAKQNRLFRCYRKLSYHLKQATLHAWLLLCILCGGLSMPLRFWLEPVRAASLLRKPKTIMPGLLFFLSVCFPSAGLIFFARLGRAFPESAALVGLEVFKRSLSSQFPNDISLKNSNAVLKSSKRGMIEVAALVRRSS